MVKQACPCAGAAGSAVPRTAPLQLLHSLGRGASAAEALAAADDYLQAVFEV